MKLISCLFLDSATKQLKKEDDFKFLIKWVNIQTKINDVRLLENMHLPISKKNKDWISKSDNRIWNKINSIRTLNEFAKFIKQKNLILDLNDEQFINTKNKFYDLLISENSKVEQLSAIFADYGEFLNNCVNNKHIDKRIIEKEIIRVQKNLGR